MGTHTIGWALTVISGTVLLLTFPTRGSAPLAPGLIPVFGVLFSLLFLLVQACLAPGIAVIRYWVQPEYRDTERVSPPAKVPHPWP